jgi:ParB/RepB/Spo0J family partition protein
MNEIKGRDIIVNIDKVKANTWNPKESIEENEENKEKYEEIKKEIEKKGLFEAITVRELGDKYEILDGYHRWLACKELGFSKIRVNTLGEISDELARAITVIKEQKKIPISELKVAEIVNWYLEKGVKKGNIMSLLGYNENTLEEYSSLFNFDWEEYKVEFGGGVEDEEGIVEEENLLGDRRLIIKVLEEDYNKIKQRYEELGKKKFIGRIVNI